MYAIKSTGSRGSFDSNCGLVYVHKPAYDTRDQAERVLDRLVTSQPSRRSYLSVIEISSVDELGFQPA